MLVGHSFGGSILLKYLATEAYRIHIAGLFLVATPYWSGDEDWQIEHALPEDFAAKLPQIARIVLYHSRNDGEIPFAHLERFKAKLPRGNCLGARRRCPFFHRWA